MFKAVKTYYYLPASANEDSINKLKSRIRVYFPDVIFLSSDNDHGIGYGGFPIGVLDNNNMRMSRIVLDSIDQVDHNPEKFIHFYIELYKRDIYLAFYRASVLNTENVYRLCSIFKNENDITQEDIRMVLEFLLSVYLNEKESYRYEKMESVKEARKIRELTGTQEENELRKSNAFEVIKKYSRDFDGQLSDVEVMKMLDVGRNTFYRYKKEMKKLQSESQNK